MNKIKNGTAQSGEYKSGVSKTEMGKNSLDLGP